MKKNLPKPPRKLNFVWETPWKGNNNPASARFLVSLLLFNLLCRFNNKILTVFGNICFYFCGEGSHLVYVNARIY